MLSFIFVDFLNHCILNVLYSVIRFLGETKKSKGIKALAPPLISTAYVAPQPKPKPRRKQPVPIPRYIPKVVSEKEKK